MKKIESFIFTLLILFLLIPICVLSVNSAIIETVTIHVSGVNALAINLNQGEKAVGSFSISGHSVIGFKIKNPIGESVVDYTVVNEGTTFEILAEHDGAYTLSFTNNSNHYESVISVSYNIESGISSITSVPPMWIILIIISFLFGLSIGIILYLRKKP